MRIGIPTYQRVNAFYSLKTLSDMGYGAEDIIVSTQTRAEYEEYQKVHGNKCTIIYREGANDSVNRNTILNYMNPGEEFVLMDDDIKVFNRLEVKGGKSKLIKIGTRAEFEEILRKQFAFCRKYNSPVFAWYTVDNAYFMSKTAHLRQILNGTILGIRNIPEVRFNEINDLKGDYELACRMIESGHNAVRFNGFSANAGSNTPGGCQEARAKGHNKVRCRALLERYPELLKPHPRRQGEVRFVGNTKKVAYS